MFNFFKRREKAAAAKRAMRPPGKVRPVPEQDTDFDSSHPSSQLPEVVAEGNTPADWSAWEDSMTALDSKMQELAKPARVQVRDGRVAQNETNVDTFVDGRNKRNH